MSDDRRPWPETFRGCPLPSKAKARLLVALSTLYHLRPPSTPAPKLETQVPFCSRGSYSGSVLTLSSGWALRAPEYSIADFSIPSESTSILPGKGQ